VKKVRMNKKQLTAYPHTNKPKKRVANTKSVARKRESECVRVCACGLRILVSGQVPGDERPAHPKHPKPALQQLSGSDKKIKKTPS
jgi:hypothetical protein